MSATLPHGLITIGHTNGPTDKGRHHADVLYDRLFVLHSFWKVHAIRHRVSKDAADFRCQNLFWRTWADPILSKKITTTKLTALWSACQQPFNPASWGEGFGASTKASVQRNNYKHAEPSYGLNRTKGQTEPSATLTSVAEHADNSTSQVQGLFTDSTPSTNGASDFSLDTDGTKKGPKAARPNLARTSSSGTRTLFGLANTKSKGRPSVNRRKSSQGVSQPKPARLNKASIKSPILDVEESDKPTLRPSTVTTSAFELPSVSSWEDEPSKSSGRLSTSISHSDNPSELVESNFRNKFVERMASFSNIAGMNRIKKTGSVVRFADEKPNDLLDSRVDFISEAERRPALSQRGSVASVAIIDEDDDMPPPGLPRTKSQLSMMIDEARSQQAHGPSEPMSSPEYGSISNRRRREPTEDEKVLAMAHSEGVTRSGGRRVRQGFKFSDENESRYSSPSPPPLF